jgi:hypothetical protein
LKLPQYSLIHGAIPEALTVPQAQEVMELMGYKYTKSSHPKVKKRLNFIRRQETIANTKVDALKIAAR